MCDFGCVLILISFFVMVFVETDGMHKDSWKLFAREASFELHECPLFCLDPGKPSEEPDVARMPSSGP